MAENKNVQLQREKVMATQARIQEVNDDLSNLEEDVKALIIERGLTPTSSYVSALVTEKS